MVKGTQHTKKKFVKKQKTSQTKTHKIHKGGNPNNNKNTFTQNNEDNLTVSWTHLIQHTNQFSNENKFRYSDRLQDYTKLQTKKLRLNELKIPGLQVDFSTNNNSSSQIDKAGHVGAFESFGGLSLKKVDDDFVEFMFYYKIYILIHLGLIDMSIQSKIPEIKFVFEQDNNISKDVSKSIDLTIKEQSGGFPRFPRFGKSKKSKGFSRADMERLREMNLYPTSAAPTNNPPTTLTLNNLHTSSSTNNNVQTKANANNISEYVLAKAIANDKNGKKTIFDWIVMENLISGMKYGDVLDFKIGYYTLSNYQDVQKEKQSGRKAIEKKLTQNVMLDSSATSKIFGFRMEGGKLTNTNQKDDAKFDRDIECFIEDKTKCDMLYMYKQDTTDNVKFKLTKQTHGNPEKFKKMYNHPFNNFQLIYNRIKQNADLKNANDLFKKILKGLEDLMLDLFIPNYKALSDPTKVAFGCVGTSIMIGYGKDNIEWKVNAKLADFGHGYLYFTPNANDVKFQTDFVKKMLQHKKYVENMTIGAYQLYNMFYLYCNAVGIIIDEPKPNQTANTCYCPKNNNHNIRKDLSYLINKYRNKEKIIFT